MNTRKPFAARALAAALALGPAWAGASTTHTVVTGEHLWRLAGDYYKNHYRWRAIHEANTDKVKDPHWIYPGQILVIPDMGEEAKAPVEAAAAIEAPPAEAPAEPAEDEVISPASEASARVPALGEGGPASEDLSREMPPAVTGHFTNMARVKAPKGWKEDGKVTVFEGREIMAAEGDLVNGKISAKAAPAPGDRFTVYRRAAVMEGDEDAKGLYLQRVGVVEVKEKLSGSAYRLLIRRSGDAVQLGDFLKKE